MVQAMRCRDKHGRGRDLADACRAYITPLRGGKEPRPATAHDAEKRFERTIYDDGLGRRLLAKLVTAHITEWGDGLGRTKSTVNRAPVALKAALNMAVRNKQFSPSLALEWKNVAPYKNAGVRGTLFLDSRIARRRDRPHLRSNRRGDGYRGEGGRAGERHAITV